MMCFCSTAPMHCFNSHFHICIKAQNPLLLIARSSSTRITSCFIQMCTIKVKTSPQARQLFEPMHSSAHVGVICCSKTKVWPTTTGSRAHLIRQIKCLSIPEIYFVPRAVSNPSLISCHWAVPENARRHVTLPFAAFCESESSTPLPPSSSTAHPPLQGFCSGFASLLCRCALTVDPDFPLPACPCLFPHYFLSRLLFLISSPCI